MAKSFLDAFKGLTQKKGTKDKEIEKYEKMLSDQPDDRNALNALGDLYAKRGDAVKACEYYLQVGGLYAKDGFTLKAIAVYKKAQRAKPEMAQTYLDLADLYVQKGLIGEAKSNYLTAAEMNAAAGAKHESLDIYRKIADLDPANISIRSKLAAMYEKEKFLEDAAMIYTEIGDAIMRQNGEEGPNYYRRAIELQPDNPNILSRIGYAYGEHAMRPEAIEIFKRLLELDPANYIDYKEQLRALQSPPPSGPQAVPAEMTSISFSEEELTSLNLGEEAVTGLNDLTEHTGHSAVSEHILEFPLADMTAAPTATAQGVEEHTLDFQIEDQGKMTWDQQTATPTSPAGGVGELSFEDSLEQVSFEDQETQVTPEKGVAAPPEPPKSSQYFDLAARLDTAAKLGREYEGAKPEKAKPEKAKPERTILKVETAEHVGESKISDLIKEFKQGVLEEVGTEDYETHYELGISYKEMSLLDDAIEELKLAALEPGKFVECQGVIGLCYLEKNDYKSALQAFRDARSKVKPRGEEFQDLTYQIALVFEKAGKVEEAVVEFQTLFQIKANYRDVKQRLNKLLG